MRASSRQLLVGNAHARLTSVRFMVDVPENKSAQHSNFPHTFLKHIRQLSHPMKEASSRKLNNTFSATPLSAPENRRRAIIPHIL